MSLSPIIWKCHGSLDPGTYTPSENTPYIIGVKSDSVGSDPTLLLRASETRPDMDTACVTSIMDTLRVHPQ